MEAEERERRAAQVLAEAEAEAERIALEKKRKKQERCVTLAPPHHSNHLVLWNRLLRCLGLCSLSRRIL